MEPSLTEIEEETIVFLPDNSEFDQVKITLTLEDGAGTVVLNILDKGNHLSGKLETSRPALGN